jgi:hypothetical protein
MEFYQLLNCPSDAPISPSLVQAPYGGIQARVLSDSKKGRRRLDDAFGINLLPRSDTKGLPQQLLDPVDGLLPTYVLLAPETITSLLWGLTGFCAKRLKGRMDERGRLVSSLHVNVDYGTTHGTSCRSRSAVTGNVVRMHLDLRCRILKQLVMD